MTAAVERSTVVRRVVITLIVLACIAGLALAVNRTETGEEDVALSGPADIVELLVPSAGSEILRQDRIGIDLAPGWDANLIVNGISIPNDQLDKTPALNQVYFQPGDGKVIEELRPGPNCAQALPYLERRGADAARPPIRWCFEVT